MLYIKFHLPFNLWFVKYNIICKCRHINKIPSFGDHPKLSNYNKPVKMLDVSKFSELQSFD